jgi:mannose-1-phosphate guanylyltransferase
LNSLNIVADCVPWRQIFRHLKTSVAKIDKKILKIPGRHVNDLRMSEKSNIVPVILSGGSGTRLWPMSRDERPKQFLPLTGPRTMFQLTLDRVADGFADPIVVANARHADLIEAQLEGRQALIILEPAARNTAPAIALAALAAQPGDVLLVMPSDHLIADSSAFRAAVDAALPLAERGWMCTFGITPDAPETGYGYIAMAEEVSAGVHRVDRFVEKPDRASAEAMLAQGSYVWNGGIFLFRADAYLRALEAFAPAMLAAVRDAHDKAVRDGARLLPDADAFAASPANSIDYAVMEKADRVAVVPVSMGWSDIGSWDALYAIGDPHDGDVIEIDTENCLLRTDGVKIAAVGIKDLIVIASGDSVLIVKRGHSQDVKRIVEALKAGG